METGTASGRGNGSCVKNAEEKVISDKAAKNTKWGRKPSQLWGGRRFSGGNGNKRREHPFLMLELEKSEAPEKKKKKKKTFFARIEKNV